MSTLLRAGIITCGLAATVLLAADPPVPTPPISPPVATSGNKGRTIGDGPSFKKDNLALTIKSFKADSEFDFAAKTPRILYEVSLKAAVIAPSNVDIVGFSEELTVTSAVDAKGAALLDTKKGSRTAKPTSGASTTNLVTANKDNFNAILDSFAETKLDTTNLTAQPFTVKKMSVRGVGVYAKERAEIKIPGRVVEDESDVGHGMKLRLSQMKISNNRDATVSVEYTRAEGTAATIPEAIYAIDAAGKSLGGGRWHKASRIFGGKGVFQAEFTLQRTDNIAGFKLVLLTKYEVKPVEFEIDGIFQK